MYDVISPSVVPPAELRRVTVRHRSGGCPHRCPQPHPSRQLRLDRQRSRGSGYLFATGAGQLVHDRNEIGVLEA